MSEKYWKSKLETYRALGISANTFNVWEIKPGFPKKTRWGYPKQAVLDWAQAYNDAKSAGKTVGDRAEKIRLECEKLRVVIKREQEFLKVAEIETQQREGDLIPVKDVAAQWSRRALQMRNVVESWRVHNTAKYPDMAGRIDEVVDGLVDQMREVFESP